MIIIQVLLITFAIMMIVKLLRERSTHSMRAWKKMGFIFLGIVMIVVIASPSISNVVAQFVGVGRGADLLLYLTVLTFVLFVLNDYLHRQEQRDIVCRLARRLALIDAFKRHGIIAADSSKVNK